MADQIILKRVRVMAHVGVPDNERLRTQPLEISVVMHRNLRPAGLTDRIQKTVDYARVHQMIFDITALRPRRLIETLAEDIAKVILKTFKISRVEVEIRKFILKKTQYVAVRIDRSA